MPLKINKDGTRYWFDSEKQRHREDGPAVEFAQGSKYWYKHGRRHRNNGPAVELINGFKEWFKEGKRHRLDGPASELVRFDFKQYWIEGKEYTEEEYLRKVACL